MEERLKELDSRNNKRRGDSHRGKVDIILRKDKLPSRNDSHHSLLQRESRMQLLSSYEEIGKEREIEVT